ncbi:MAG: hypothetical protein K6G15_05070 [Desulfovibrio sp.]|nr:hypothetical protein [Desulfovibrio sp.]
MLSRKLPVLFLFLLFLSAGLLVEAESAQRPDQPQFVAAKTREAAAPKAQRKPKAPVQNQRNKGRESTFELLKSPGQDSPRPFSKPQSILEKR